MGSTTNHRTVSMDHPGTPTPLCARVRAHSLPYTRIYQMIMRALVKVSGVRMFCPTHANILRATTLLVHVDNALA